ncbi:MAG: hypothetical protein B6244_14500 [Candidatus Cloacimonetes bacterium 4572_55]|nr:MAG: hypothetical protein B6244_14500 [Candidatus Cloacimonetes bacterium 4572_55]
MGTAGNAQIQYESAQTLVPYAAMTDSGDQMVFTVAGPVWSGRSGYGPNVRPDGVVSGIDILSPGSGVNEIDSTGFIAWIEGVQKIVSGTTITVTRASSLTHVINSIVLTGTTLSAVKGTEGSTFSTTRAAAGGPPYIPVGSIEIGQIKTSAQASALIESSEIFQTPNTHQERADFPLYRRPDNTGRGILASSISRKYAHIEFYEAHPLSHTGGVVKGIYIQYYTPTFTTIETNGFSPGEVDSSQEYVQRYEEIYGHKVDSLRSAAFKAELTDGITDALSALDGEMLLFKFFPNAGTAPYMLTMGILRFSSAFPQVGAIDTACTVISKLPTAKFTGA